MTALDHPSWVPVRAIAEQPTRPRRRVSLRLDSLEGREQPGSVLVGLASGVLIDPLAAMALVVGEMAFRGPDAITRTGPPAGTSELPRSDSGPLAPANPAPPSLTGAADSGSSFAPTEVTAGSAVPPAGRDVPDVSFADSSQFVPPVLVPASTEPSGGTGGRADSWTPGEPVSVPGGGLDARTRGAGGANPASVPISMAEQQAGKPTANTVASAPGTMLPPAVGGRVGADTATIHSAVGDARIKLNGHGHALTGLSSAAVPAVLAGRSALRYGVFGFSVNGVRPGGIATVDLTLPAGSNPDGWYKQDRATGALSRFDFDGYTGAVIHGNTVTLSLRDGGRGDDDGIINGVVLDPGGPGYGDPVQIVTGATVREVTFSGPDLINIVADPGTPAYPDPPHWVDTDLNGSIDAPGDHALPVGYPRDRDAVVSARFAAAISNWPYPPSNYNLMVRGSNTLSATQPYYFTVPPTPVALDGTDLVLAPTTIYDPFPGTVNYGSLVINWQFSSNGGLSWQSAGRSQDELYVTLDTPVGGPVWHTPLNIGAQGAAMIGATTAAQVITETMKAFETRTVTTRNINPAFNAKPLTYYKQWDTMNTTAAAILTDPDFDGQCGAFAELFVIALRRKGVTTPMNLVTITALDQQELMFINNWSFAPEGDSGDPRYPFQNAYADATRNIIRKSAGVWEYYWGTPAEVTDLEGVPGQNTTNPRSIFQNHQLVAVGTKIYDPSYGNVFDSLQEWEDGSVAGLGKLDNPNERILIRKHFDGVTDTFPASSIPV